MKNSKKSKYFFVLAIVAIMLVGVYIPAFQAVDIKYIEGFENGPSYTNVIPMKKTTLVQFDKDGILDDYAYLAALPTAVFNQDDKLYSHPLLFYEEEYDWKENRERSLNTYQGLDYFMEDWMEYNTNQLDQMTLINVDKKNADSWDAKEYVSIKGDDPFDIADQIALHDWSFSDNAVIAVIESEYEKLDEEVKGTIEKTIPSYDMGHKTLKMERPSVGIGGNYQPFEIEDEIYKYLVAEATWKDDGFEVDLQLYDDSLGLVSANMRQNYKVGAHEIGGSYIHNLGTWEVGLTAFPKKEVDTNGFMNTNYQDTTLGKTGLFSRLRRDMVNVDIMFYPGIEVEIEKLPEFGCKDAEFTIDWDEPNAKLGFAVIDPSGTEIASSLTKQEIIDKKLTEDKTEATVDVAILGECREGENYRICVFSLDDLSNPVDFTLDYSWKIKTSKKEGCCLASATNAAVLASTLNAPLLYTSTSEITEGTKNVLYKLGVDNIYIVDFGDYLRNDVKNSLNNDFLIKVYTNPIDIYDKIRNLTGENDIIFSTIEPWEFWYGSELKPSSEDDYNGALFIGPAAYIAAHHGSPVIIVDIHPDLSQAIVYHKDFWVKNAEGREEPSFGDMVISGRKVWDFLSMHDFDEKEKMETMITVAGQFNIGPSWDRTFVGAAIPGRFHFSPVDCAYWMSRNIFYPALIFVNPAMYEETAIRINGSSSKIQRIGGRLKQPFGSTLVVNKNKAGEQEYQYPVLQSYCSAAYKFNEQASKYWGTMYTRADGITPYVTPSPDSIDVGAVPSKPNSAYYPDLDDTNVVPFYAAKAGYGSVFSSTFESVAENLNRGVIMFIQDSHGFHPDGGIVSFWDSENPYVYEENPWRAYEPILFKPGHFRNFVKLILYLLAGREAEPLKSLSQMKIIPIDLFSEKGSTENPDVAVLNPTLGNINKIWTGLTGNLIDILGAFGTRIHWDRIGNNPNRLPLVTHYDGMVTISPGSGSYTTLKEVNGYQFDDAIDNLHSVGINTVVCLPAGTYLQMTWIRHGTVYTIMDPWSTSDYCAVWLQSIVKNLALGDTIGQAYEKGIGACGPELLVGQWWWDIWENVCLYGDPNLRVYVPNDEWDIESKNTWEQKDTKQLSYNEELTINGHMPFGATSYPHEKEPQTFFTKNMFLLVIIALIIILFIIMAAIGRKKKK